MKNITIATHNGDFHSDDVFAVAILKLAIGEDANVKIIRTRDEDVIKSADYVVDVGVLYDPGTNRFDHHQEGGAGARDNTIPYAACGLVWKHFGEVICGDKKVADIIENRLVAPLDALDNGVNISTPIFKNISPYGIGHYIGSYNATWKEDGDNNNKNFVILVDFAMSLLKREISIAKDWCEGEKMVREIYEKTQDKRVIVLDKRYSWFGVIVEYSEPLFVVYPNTANNNWSVKCVRQNMESYGNRKDLPRAWAGKRAAELAEITGVPDAIFCHNKLFMAVAGSKEGAMALAKIALEN